jgi:hypothetical protein
MAVAWPMPRLAPVMNTVLSPLPGTGGMVGILAQLTPWT